MAPASSSAPSTPVIDLHARRLRRRVAATHASSSIWDQEDQRVGPSPSCLRLRLRVHYELRDRRRHGPAARLRRSRNTRHWARRAGDGSGTGNGQCRSSPTPAWRRWLTIVMVKTDFFTSSILDGVELHLRATRRPGSARGREPLARRPVRSTRRNEHVRRAGLNAALRSPAASSSSRRATTTTRGMHAEACSPPPVSGALARLNLDGPGGSGILAIDGYYEHGRQHQCFRARLRAARTGRSC